MYPYSIIQKIEMSFKYLTKVSTYNFIELSGNTNIEETNFIKSENLVINGVGNSSQNVQCKLHLFDVKNSKWLTDLTSLNLEQNKISDISALAGLTNLEFLNQLSV